GTGPLSCTGGLVGTTLVNILQLFNLQIPLAVVGDASNLSTIAVSGGIAITVKGQGWTAGVASVTGITATAPGTTVINTVTSAGSDNRGTNHGGTLKLVSGFQSITNVAGNLPGFAVQSFTFAPEPVELLLLGTGMAGFALYAGWRRRR
ncbi:MAG: PEP-CTERM sorting domain-containing protein, partial [Myxococcota bacterium]